MRLSEDYSGFTKASEEAKKGAAGGFTSVASLSSWE